MRGFLRSSQGILAAVLLGLFLLAPCATTARATPTGGGLAQSIVVRTTENVIQGGWSELVRLCRVHGIARIELLLKQDEDDFYSWHTDRVLQSGELLAALPDERTAAGWENSDWLRAMIAEAHASGIEVWAWWPTFHDAQMAQTDARHTYINRSGQVFVDPAVPEFRARQEELLLKLLTNYDLDGVSLDWIRYDDWDGGLRGPLAERFHAEFGIYPNMALFQDADRRYVTRWNELRRGVLNDWIVRITAYSRAHRPSLRWAAFVLPWQFEEVSQDYAGFSAAGLDRLQPMAYWQGWNYTPQWAGSLVEPRYLTTPTLYWPTLNAVYDPQELLQAMLTLPRSALGGITWFNFGRWEEKHFIGIQQVLASYAALQGQPQ